MKIKIKEFNIYIDELVLIVIFLCCIFSNVRQYFSNYFICYLFIAFHEFSHMFVASIFGVKTTKLSIRISGLCINLNKKKIGTIKWLLIFLAGPISNVILALIFKNIPLVYTINLVLAAINLVPIYPLDGCNIFEIILQMLNAKSIDKIQDVTAMVITTLLAILGIYQLVFLKNPSITLMVIYIYIQRELSRKNNHFVLYQKYYKNVTKFN